MVGRGGDVEESDASDDFSPAGGGGIGGSGGFHSPLLLPAPFFSSFGMGATASSSMREFM